MKKYSLDNNERVKWIDLAKGIGIILVVWAHASGPFSGYIEQFHMPLFFILSGLLYSPRSYKEFFCRKFKHLYFPFLTLNICFEMFSFIFLDKDKNFFHLLKLIGLTILTLEKSSLFMGATWFLGSLFLTEIFIRLLDELHRRLIIHKWVEYSIILTLVIVGFEFNLPYRISRTLILMGFFEIGKEFRSIKDSDFLKNSELGVHIIIIVLSSITFYFIAKDNYALLGENNYSSPVLFYVGAIAASISIMMICFLICRFCCDTRIISFPIDRIVSLGKNSVDVLIWQFVFFRPVIILQLIIERDDWHKFLRFYPTYKIDGIWWIIYVLAAIVFSRLICELFRFFVLMLKRWKEGKNEEDRH